MSASSWPACDKAFRLPETHRSDCTKVSAFSWPSCDKAFRLPESHTSLTAPKCLRFYDHHVTKHSDCPRHTGLTAPKCLRLHYHNVTKHSDCPFWRWSLRITSNYTSHLPGEELWKRKWRRWTTAGAPSRGWSVTDRGGGASLLPYPPAGVTGGNSPRVIKPLYEVQ